MADPTFTRSSTTRASDYLSPAACNRRVARLRDAGLIEAGVAIVSPERVGYAIQFTVLLSMESERAPDAFERLKRTMPDCPEIVNAVSVAGPAVRAPHRSDGRSM